ncbi:hypothetical protein [Mycobacterium interjectum]|uniref:hypothetical protein n=1 Tax=Mycobacterium interjectum TaxID=33895 RepID=UPI0008341262|nr:hypothetical protein [Mycobacterium interjectum]MCV7090209.1 hypothetical protein [Mycobacterium interjectum]
MNRRQRRAQARDPHSASKIRDLQHRVETTGRPGIIYGLDGACSDCSATGELHLFPGKKVIGHIFHDDGCPAAAGTVTWQPESIK